MNISRPTFTRLIDRARQKTAAALIDGMELVIAGGNVNLQNTLYKCRDCGDTQELPISYHNENCPDCGSENIDDLSQNYINKEDK
jgi:Zn finger protein HypA/HybF involved in hydrogenase expression